ncbi:hypothetical protein VCHC59A1_2631 [Vibrio cholerae HC-59A1]|nr:hypothetical protein VCHC02A1_2588 [Vibrio cholerae HC-02A1]EKL11542.1 hypothetical protein VCHC59A1_2631 [Vibrio cholerae HC-59A1]EKL11857.1 hypothetical protein VCHC60A1_2584 [Vibrio cholerae HC-60A1]EKL98362.1 hypothetical protein VCHC55B2_2789 [Vibrio cholerae HC-55B2]
MIGMNKRSQHHRSFKSEGDIISIHHSSNSLCVIGINWRI